ncbi:MAG: YceD family protein [Acidimicrobiales bacterium]
MRRPFVVNVGEELRHPGTQRPLTLAGTVPRVGLSSSRIVEGTDVHFDGTVEAQGSTVVVQGQARAAWTGECRRCLEPIVGELHVDLREVFEPEPVEGETFPLDDDQVDLEPVMREVLALALPAAPLCGEDCAGPDPDAHPVGGLSDPSGQDGQAKRDPRWAVLDQLRIDR